MTTKHTEGPWHTKENGVLVLGPKDAFGVYRMVAVVEGTDTPEEQRANARLIAAAPELLEACKYFEEILEHALSDAEKLALPNSVVNIGSLMRAAIGKATGQ